MCDLKYTQLKSQQKKFQTGAKEDDSQLVKPDPIAVTVRFFTKERSESPQVQEAPQESEPQQEVQLEKKAEDEKKQKK